MKSNPNGIIFIGVGVVLIALAYTDRGAAVWRAIKGDASPVNKPGAGKKAPTR